MTTPLAPPQHQNPRKDRQKEIEALLDDFDSRTGKNPRDKQAQPLHDESKLSKKTRDLLDQQEQKPKPQKSGGFYQETAAQKVLQDKFDQTLKHIPANGTGTWQATPPTKKERLLAWHKSLGSPQHVIDAELAQLEAQEAGQQ